MHNLSFKHDNQPSILFDNTTFPAGRWVSGEQPNEGITEW